VNRRAPERQPQPAVFWLLLAFNIVMYALVIPMGLL
jgi:hypothetical protein